MAYGSRLRERRQTKTIASVAKTLSGGQYSESNELTGLTATYEQQSAFETATDAGALVSVVDVFWFEPVSGVLPDIEEKNVLTDGDSVRYEVIEVKAINHLDRLQVITRRLR